jgi:hypothetical protein
MNFMAPGVRRSVETLSMDGQVMASAPPDLLLPDIDRLLLHNLVLQHQALQGQLNVLMLQFLRTAEPRALQDRIDALAEQIRASTEKLYAAHGIDPTTHQLNVERGTFVSRSDPE